MSERMALTPEELALLEEKIKKYPVLSNAFRLFCDASLLFDFERFASAIALAFISLEEAGKYLLETWSKEDENFTYDKRKLHIMKQGAVAALFLAFSARKKCIRNNFDFKNMSSLEDLTQLAKHIHAGLEKEKDFASYVLNKVIEISKLSGMYYDETRAAQGIGPDKIKKNDAKSVMETTCKAFMLISEEKNIALGKYCFPYIYPKALPEEDRNSQA